VRCAAERARLGNGATLIEAITYRLGDHTTADDARRYRSDTEVSEHFKGEPIARLRAHLVRCGAWGRDDEAGLLLQCREQVDRAVEAYLATSKPAPTDMLDFLFERLPPALAAQRQALAGEAGAHG
jgi:pyruvate dehydrogenase E1 component alpha subunit